MCNVVDPDAYQKAQSALRVARVAWHKRFPRQIVHAEAKRILDEVADHLKGADLTMGSLKLDIVREDLLLNLDLPQQAALKVALEGQNIKTSQATTVLTWDPSTASFNPDPAFKEYSAVDALIHVAVTELLITE